MVGPGELGGVINAAAGDAEEDASGIDEVGNECSQVVDGSVSARSRGMLGSEAEALMP